MWLQHLTNYLLRHRFQTLIVVLGITFIPVVGILGIVIAAFITLRKGVLEGIALTVAATVPYLTSFYFSNSHEGNTLLVVGVAVGVAVLSNLLTLVFTVMRRRKMSFSAIFQLAALVGVLVISLVHLAYPNVSDWWGTELQTYYTQASTIIKSQPVSSEARLDAINMTKQYATGMIVAAILFNALFQLMMARWWEAVVFYPGSLRKELYQIRLSPLAGILFIVSLVLSYLGNAVVLDIMPVLYTLFVSAALSLSHALLARNSSSGFVWVLVFYLALVIFLPMSVVVVSMAALSDIWLNLRKRVLKKG